MPGLWLKPALPNRVVSTHQYAKRVRASALSDEVALPKHQEGKLQPGAMLGLSDLLLPARRGWR